MSTLQSQLLASLQEFTAFARKRLSDPELAADAVQESLLKALQAQRQPEEGENAKAWFYRILRHTIIDLYRRQDVRDRALSRLERELSGPPTEDEDRTVCACLHGLVPTLKQEYAEVIARLDLEGRPYRETAASLGISENNLKVRLHRARQQLRERLETTCGMCAVHGCLDCTCGTRGATERSCGHG